jgi:hypothetical protein
VGALSLSRPGGPGGGSPEPRPVAGRARTTTGAAHPRSVAPASGAVRPLGRGPARTAGEVRQAAHRPHVWPRQPTGGPGTARHQLAVPGWPGEATPGGAGRRGWRRVCGSRPTTPTGLRGWGESAHARPSPRCAALPAPGGAAPQSPGGAAPSPRRRPARRRAARGPAAIHDHVHAFAPDVSGPLAPGPVRFLIPDQNVRRQRTTRSLTPRASAPCQAAPRTPRP